MSSDKQIKANRLNAQQSTGPRTPEGKARVSRNARKHGLTGRDIVLPNESPEDYDAFREGLLDDLSPCGPLEEMLADRLVSVAWRLRRVPMFEAGLHRRAYQTSRVGQASIEVKKFLTPMFDSPELERVTDQAAHAVAERQLKEETAKLEALSGQIVDGFETASIALANLGRHETMLLRSSQSALHELQRLQAARAGQYVATPAVVDVNVDIGRSAGGNAESEGSPKMLVDPH